MPWCASCTLIDCCMSAVLEDCGLFVYEAVVPTAVMVCLLFDDKSTLVFVGDTLEGMETIAPQRAHTRDLIKIDIVRQTSECRF